MKKCLIFTTNKTKLENDIDSNNIVAIGVETGSEIVYNHKN